MDPTLIVALIGAALGLVGTASAATIGFFGQRALHTQAAKFALSQESEGFIAEQLDHLYLPVAMRLAATKVLFDRYFESSTADAEKEAIEHELRIHNAEIRDRLMLELKYLEPDAPTELTVELLEHLIQWETVYKLKYEYRVYEGPVFAGIDEFGFRGFPQGADVYFNTKMKELRERRHQRVQAHAA